MSGPVLAAATTRVGGGNLVVVAVILVIALAALGFAGWLVREVLAAGQGSPKMQEIAKAVQEGAAAYLARQFKTLAVFAVLGFLLLLVLPAESGAVRIGRSVFFLVGAALSATVGFVGMTLATRANVRVAAAAAAGGAAEAAGPSALAGPSAATGPSAAAGASAAAGSDAAADGASGIAGAGRRAMRIAFRAGGVAGMLTVGLGLLGAALVLLIFNDRAPAVLEGFGFGAALLAMFMRVGGGIFTKAADVGADLVGKVEAGIPEDDPRNAATIADNVGDNVGDCAGMAADLFESYAVTLVAALILGKAAFGVQGLVFPLIVPAIGVVTAVIGILAVSPSPRDRTGMSAINRGFFISAAVSAVLVALAAFSYLPGSFAGLSGVPASVQALSGDPRWIAIGAVIIGLVLAAAIQLLTGYFTETSRKPVQDIARASLTGPATVILTGVSVGLESAVYSALLIAGGVYLAFLLGGGSVIVSLFAVALAGTGLLTTVGVIVSMDTFGPVSDNAQGIAEMSGEIDAAGARVLTDLDAVGNTTKAITKGIAIATAVLAATALFGSFRTTVETALTAGGNLASGFSLSVDQPNVLVGLIIGAAVVFLFSGLAINAVSRAAGRVVFEVREQFRTKPGIMDFTERPEYGRVVDICTRDSLRELATPGLLAVLAPIAVGFGLGYAPLGAYLAGAIAAGVLMAVYLANSGGAWDNAKKLVEEGLYGGKGSDAHAATVIGDTVGDPFKDTAGPALNPLIKVMNLVALLIAPAVVRYGVGADKNLAVKAGVAVVAVAIVVAAVVFSKRRSVAVGAEAPAGPPVERSEDPAASKL